jgi:pimeloyl-ACP methyl ester carboxylesterase
VVLAAAAVALAAAQAPALTLRPCNVQTMRARCGVYRVAENRARPNGRTIGLRVVVVPAWGKQKKAADAVTYLAGGPGGAATELTQMLVSEWPWLVQKRDLLLVDQRGTGASNAFKCTLKQPATPTKAKVRAYVRACVAQFGGDSTQYGTRTAMDDLDAIRAALGYRKLDVVGGSYGATAAQMFLRLHPASVRTVVLLGATALEVPFWSRWAPNAQRALGKVAFLCASDPDCKKAYPRWTQQLGSLIRSWNAHPIKVAGQTVNGDGLASLVQAMLLGADRSVLLPWAISHAARGDLKPLRDLAAAAEQSDDGSSQLLMYWTIMCNEPWVGLAAKGPWGTLFDGAETRSVGNLRLSCPFVPKHADPPGIWKLSSSKTVPVLALQGGADPQDPVGNLPGLRERVRDSRVVVLPFYGHQFSMGGCVGDLITSVIEHGTTKGLETGCVASLVTPPFRYGA